MPTIVSGDRSSYRSAARWLNESDVDLVLVEHEFGIHGGVDGARVLDLTEHLQIPYVVTLHTVLTRFTTTPSAILQTLCGHAAGITLFTATAGQMVLEQEFARSSALTVVPHGAPVELYRPTGRGLRTELGLGDDDAIVSTFGLLSPGKGIEITIAAMRQIATEMPHVRYVIAGRTHPGVQRTAGGQYRAELQTLVASLGLDEHVRFVDRFLTVDEIAELLSVTKVFLTPYRNADQIVSGALTFTITAGCPVVSTPYRYGVDMVGHGASGHGRAVRRPRQARGGHAHVADRWPPASECPRHRRSRLRHPLLARRRPRVQQVLQPHTRTRARRADRADHAGHAGHAEPVGRHATAHPAARRRGDGGGDAVDRTPAGAAGRHLGDAARRPPPAAVGGGLLRRRHGPPAADRRSSARHQRRHQRWRRRRRRW